MLVAYNNAFEEQKACRLHFVQGDVTNSTYVYIHIILHDLQFFSLNLLHSIKIISNFCILILPHIFPWIFMKLFQHFVDASGSYIF